MYVLVEAKAKAYLRRIRDNQYEFPTDRTVSHDSRQLIQQILTPDPQMRPTLHEIVDHEFFTRGIVPPFIPTSAHDGAPDFRTISKSASEANLRRLRRHALLDEDQVTSIAVPKAPSANVSAAAKSVTSSIAQQEKEFQKAVQPGSPISALLSSARQPLMMGTNSRESPLLRKLQAVSKESPLARGGGGTRAMRGLQNIDEEEELGSSRVRSGKGEEDVRRKELESQKARIVAQMAPVREEEEDERENAPPARREGKTRERVVAGKQTVLAIIGMI